MTRTVTLARPLPVPEIEIGGEAVEFLPVAAPGEVPDRAEVHCTTSLDPLPAEAIAALPGRVGLIANIGVGVDNIDLAAAAARGIAVSNTPVVTEDTADLAFALILAACRRIGQAERFLRGGQWAASGTAPPLGGRVHGRTLGLVGFGAIAQAVARRARGFDMEVLYWNRTRRPEAEATTGAAYQPDLDALMGQCDILSVHTALRPQTRDLIDADRLDKVRRGAVLVNTARGGIVDEAALVAALEDGRLAAAGLDVFAAEPEVDPGLLGRDDVVLTPHIGSATDACRADMARRLLANVTSFLEHGRVIDPVQPG
ncbi:2-hydroxyacid dehydrogenase [Pukyongiella litopenaei]|uniref:D-glycerate dehydrogenase n=1 Tax=Pukyongiella litopenaei TaxID=2605946 RepID=A0A2S0MRD4_9RHOB|nr:D-glycerate dehydrogenase [Pukyongiella litopenaei]AVO38448.1 D-glycerate dehydrogenase [Pukyongiella litopenaei]